MAHENNVADILVVLELESEAEHFLGVNADNGAGALVEYVRDIVVVHLTAVRLACFVGRVELCDINGLVCLDDLDRAGNVCKFNYIALCASALCVNLEFIFVDCGLAVGYDVELVGGIFAGVFVRGHLVADGAVLCSVALQAVDRNGNVIVGCCGIAGYNDVGVCNC